MPSILLYIILAVAPGTLEVRAFHVETMAECKRIAWIVNQGERMWAECEARA